MSSRALVAIPHVPHGPVGVAPEAASADYYRSAAENIRFQAERGRSFAGSNLTEAVAQLCEQAAVALERQLASPVEEIDARFYVVDHPSWPDGYMLSTREEADAFLARHRHLQARIVQHTVLMHAPTL